MALGTRPADEPQSREAIRAAIAGNSLGSVAVLWGAVALAAALSFGAAVGL